jgi:HD-GYP domain-containing protein (c-di-GMP phosphodiesterase class II)
MPPESRLAEILGALSLACDAAFGFPVEKALRTSVLAVELGRRHGLRDDVLRDIFYSTLLTYAGCTAFSHEVSALSDGDDIATSNTMIVLDIGDPIDALGELVSKLGARRGLVHRARMVARVLLGGSKLGDRHAYALCDVATHLAEVVGMSAAVRAALGEICERWDGKGGPRRVAGDALLMPMRVVNVAHIAEIAHHRAGRAAAIEVVKRRAGGQFDPAVASTFVSEAAALFEAVERPSTWEAFLDAEPRPRVTIDAASVDRVAVAFAGVGDLKSVWTLGHSRGVARLAGTAADVLGLSDTEKRRLNLAALLHDIGRLSVPNRIWDKPSRLSRSEWEVVRMHAYWTERVLTQSSVLRPAGELASRTHERLDGSGYHRGAPSSMLGRSAGVLAAADAYHAMREPRPHRPALDLDHAASILADDVTAGRLDRVAVGAVLEAIGAKRPIARSSWPRGLTDREVEVLRLLARGQSNKGIAAALGISARTAQHHVIHIYGKIDRNSRAGAALFATEYGLLDDP